MKPYRYLFLFVAGSFIVLSGCLLTVGAPLARKVEPGKVIVEGAGGPLATSSTSGSMGFSSYLYAGKNLGKHFEIGLLPYIYRTFVGGSGEVLAGVIAVPLKWDPFNYSLPFHLTVFAAPSFFMGDINGPLVYEGIGLSYDFHFPLQLYASYAIPYYAFNWFTGNIGFRYRISERLYIGADAMISMFTGYGLNLTVGTECGTSP